MKRHYRIRHAILKILFKQKMSFDGSTPYTKTLITYPEINKRLPRYDSERIWQGLEYLTTTHEIHCSMEGRNSHYGILASGTLALHEKKYLVQGGKEFRELMFEWIKIASTIILLAIGVASFVINIIQTGKNSRDIENMKTELGELKVQLNQSNKK